MDENPDKSFQEQSSSGSRSPQQRAAFGSQSQKPLAAIEDGKHDRWRILLVELAFLLNDFLRNAADRKSLKAEKNIFRQLIKVVDELDQMPVHDGFVHISLRGVRSPEISEPTDYVIQYGSVTVDVPTVVSLISRMGIRFKHLEGRLIKSFESFADQGFSTLHLRLPGESAEAMEDLRASLKIIACFNQAVEKNAPIDFTKDDASCSLLPILNELNQPDANLTMLAAVNDLRPSAMTELVEKLTAKNDPAASGFSVFHRLFKIKHLQRRLKKPPLEIENDRAAFLKLAQKKGEALGGVEGKAPENMIDERIHLEMDPSVLKEGVARFVKGTFGNSPTTATRMMKSIYGKDYTGIQPLVLGQRLKLITDLLMRMHKSPIDQNVAAEVLKRIQSRMDQVPGEILDDFVVQDEELKFWSEGAEATVGRVDKNLLKILDGSKTRAGARIKEHIQLSPDMNFTDQDFEAIAADFEISVRDTQEVIQLYQNCFDRRGNFLRTAFEKNVPGFARHEKKVFEILWVFLKQTPRRSNRLPFLNSLQFLGGEIKKPIQAIKVLLADFIQNPESVYYPDRNAMMLVNQLLREYNKEVIMDIEMTPEEVLLVKGGLDENVVNYVAWKVDGEQKPFLQKIATIRKKITETMDSDISERPLLPIRFLLALEREVHIFLALVGGKTACEVMRSALNDYGNPASQIYHLRESPEQMEPLLSHLAAVIRGWGRLGRQADILLLDEVKIRQDQFMDLQQNMRYQTLVRHVMGLIDASKAAINSRNNSSAFSP
jgi:hypothetical protein